MIALIIDDEDMILKISTRVLEKAGFKVLTANNGTEGIRCFAEHGEEISLVIVDYFMNGLSGVETIRKLREISPSVRCVLSSGGNIPDEELPEDLKENTYILPKPYRSDQLLAMVSDVVSR